MRRCSKRSGKTTSAALRRLAAACLAFATAAIFALAGCGQAAEIAPKGQVDDYTWSELAAISNMIAERPDEGEALEVAKKYHLVTDEDTLDGTQAKTVELANGRAVRAVIAGFNQDKQPDGTPIGVTFLFESVAGAHNMNGDAGSASLADQTEANVVGGWTASEMREWLNGEFAASLPSDLRASIVVASKTGIAVPQGQVLAVDSDDRFSEQASETLLQATDDTLWLPSACELAGTSVAESSDLVYKPWESLVAQEGSQYKLFVDTPGFAFEGSGESKKRDYLWLRTPTATSFAVASADGSVDCSYEEPASEALGVMPGFCV